MHLPTPNNFTPICLLAAPGVVSGPSVVTPSDSTTVMSWSAPQLTYGRLTGYVLSIVQLLDYGVPVSGTAMNATVDDNMMSYHWSGLSKYAQYHTPQFDVLTLCAPRPRSTLPDVHQCSQPTWYWGPVV